MMILNCHIFYNYLITYLFTNIPFYYERNMLRLTRVQGAMTGSLGAIYLAGLNFSVTPP